MSQASASAFRLAFVQSLAAEHGGTCLSPVYCAKTMRWRCAEGHEWDASAQAIRLGHWCKICAHARIATIHMTRGFARAQEVARGRGGECLSAGYNSPDDVLRWRCARGHEWECTAQTIRGGTWCPACWAEDRLSLTIEDMQATARERGGECVSPNYLGPYVALIWRCARGHEWTAPPQFIRQQGTWCPHCWNGPRKGIAAVRAEARAQGGELLSPRFLGSEVPHRYRCRIGHEFEMNPTRVAQGHWCPQCRQAAAHDRERLQEVVALRGGELVSVQCGQSRDRIRVRCGEGHEWLTLQSNLMSGAWCRECAAEARTGRPLPNLSITDMRETAATRGGECLSEQYVNSYSKLRWRCHAGHEWDATPNRIRAGSWCPICARSMRGTLNAMRSLARERGGECLSERYQNHKGRLHFRCSRGHHFIATGTVVKSGVWCPTCDPSHAPSATATSAPGRTRRASREGDRSPDSAGA